jgi:hypothetical protein
MVTTALMDTKENFYVCLYTESNTDIFEAMLPAPSEVKCRILTGGRGSVFFQATGIYLQECTVSQPKSSQFEKLPLWKRPIFYEVQSRMKIVITLVRIWPGFITETVFRGFIFNSLPETTHFQSVQTPQKQITEVFKNRILIQLRAIAHFKVLINEYNLFAQRIAKISTDSKRSYTRTQIYSAFPTCDSWRIKLYLHHWFSDPEPQHELGSLVLMDHSFHSSKIYSEKNK